MTTGTGIHMFSQGSLTGLAFILRPFGHPSSPIFICHFAARADNGSPIVNKKKNAVTKARHTSFYLFFAVQISSNLWLGSVGSVQPFCPNAFSGPSVLVWQTQMLCCDQGQRHEPVCSWPTGSSLLHSISWEARTTLRKRERSSLSP